MSESKIKPSYPGNSIMVRPDGPLICKSNKNISVVNEDGDLILKDKEFALCRCGLSNNKPFCDGTHKKQDFQASQKIDDKKPEDITGIEGELIITVKKNAMYSFKGPVTLFSRDGLFKTTRLKGALCRCGYSENKPFCDVKHKKIQFVAEEK